MEFEFYVWFTEAGCDAAMLAGFHYAEDALDFADAERAKLQRADCQYIVQTQDGEEVKQEGETVTIG